MGVGGDDFCEGEEADVFYWFGTLDIAIEDSFM